MCLPRLRLLFEVVGESNQVAMVCSYWRAQVGDSITLCFILLLFEIGFVHDEERIVLVVWLTAALPPSKPQGNTK